MNVCKAKVSADLIDGQVYSIEACMRSREHLHVLISVQSELPNVSVVAL